MLEQRITAAVAASWLAGAIAGAAITATVAAVANGLLSPIPLALRAGLAVAFLVAMIGYEWVGSRPRLPQRSWQIPRSVFTAKSRHSAAAFGYELGLGFRTYIPRLAPYGLLAAVVLVPPASTKGMITIMFAAIGFALGRSAVVLGAAVASARPERRPESSPSSRSPGPNALIGASFFALAALACWAVRVSLA